MKVLNIHERHINAPIERVAPLLTTLATTNDKIWPHEKWPMMNLDKGRTVGSNGGHGPIRYVVKRYEEGSLIEFQFREPKGLDGIHRLEMTSDSGRTILRHTIDAKTRGRTMITWALGIRPLHDALIEDTFNKIENFVTVQDKRSPWSPWVRVLRSFLK